MDSLLLLLGLAGFAAFIGGIVSFFGLFSSNKEHRIDALERDARKLNAAIDKINAQLETLKQAPSMAENPPLKVAAKEATAQIVQTIAVPEPVSEPSRVTPSVEASIQTASAPKTLEEKLAALGTSKVTPAPASQTSTSSAPISQASVAPAPMTRPTPKLIEPNFLEKGITAAKDWLLGGNTLVRSGIVILFFGVSFLLKYVAEHSHLPIEFRLLGVALLGLGLLGLGWRLRDKRKEYAWALQGGGIGVLYLTIFASLKLYQVLPAGLAFGLLIAVAFLSAAIAVLQSAMPLAVLGFAGGFLAPVLTSTGHGSHVGLLSYYLVLNLAIAFVAYFKSWRLLNVLGFAFTFIISAAWGAKNYVPAHFATTEPFLVMHFLLFTAIAVLYAQKQSTKVSDYVDATLVFGTPLVGFSLQYALLKNAPFGLAYSALALGIFYITLAWWVLTRKRDTLKFLGECFLALGVGFLTLTLPLALDGRWTSAAWAVEGVGLLWVGLKQNRTLPKLTGLGLQLLAAFAFAKGWGLSGFGDASQQNMFLGVAFIALSAWACGALLQAYRKIPALSDAFAYWGWAWWVGAGLVAIDQWSVHSYFMPLSLLFVALTSLALPYLAKTYKWPRLADLCAMLLPTMAFTLSIYLVVMLAWVSQSMPSPLANFGWLAWGVAVAVYVFNMRKNAVPQGVLYRTPFLWILTLLLSVEVYMRLQLAVAESSSWANMTWGIVPLLALLGVRYWLNQPAQTKQTSHPTLSHDWAWVGGVPIALGLMVWFTGMTLFSVGNAAPLPYVPLLNPLEITLMAVLLGLLLWQKSVAQFSPTLNQKVPVIAGGMGFVLLNSMLLRSFYHLAGTPFSWLAIFNQAMVQMAFTFLWAISAFVLMLLAHKRGHRQFWIVGAGLMAMVVAKIFLFDMAQSGSIERIASFMGAGLMLLVMGYFAPLPPKSTLIQKD